MGMTDDRECASLLRYDVFYDTMADIIHGGSSIQHSD